MVNGQRWHAAADCSSNGDTKRSVTEGWQLHAVMAVWVVSYTITITIVTLCTLICKIMSSSSVWQSITQTAGRWNSMARYNGASPFKHLCVRMDSLSCLAALSRWSWQSTRVMSLTNTGRSVKWQSITRSKPRSKMITRVSVTQCMIVWLFIWALDRMTVISLNDH